VVNEVYGWYLANQRNWPRSLPSQRELFEPGLYTKLGEAIKPFQSPRNDGSGVLDSDPFQGTQVGALGFRLAGCQLTAPDRAVVAVPVSVGRSQASARIQNIQVQVQATGGRWRIADITFPPPDGAPAQTPRRSLSDQLRQVLAMRSPSWVPPGAPSPVRTP
jgi:predicted secreted protein